MKTKFLSLIITCFISISVFAQTSVNQYKYIIVPKKYDFLREADQYQLNSLTQFLFNKYGFEAVMEGSEYPEDLKMNRCLALNSDLKKDSNLFKTKLTIILQDCNGSRVFSSKTGESREKDYKTAYNFALRDAFESVKSLGYIYEPTEKIDDVAIKTEQPNTENAEEIKRLKEEVVRLKKEQEHRDNLVSKDSLPRISKKEAKELLEEPKPETINVHKVENDTEPMVLYAQEIENGFQLVDKTPKVVYKIKKTGQQNLFLVEGENAVIYKKGDTWIVEYNTSEGTIQKELNIKF